MINIKITSSARDMVGNIATVRAEVLEDVGGYRRVKDIIEIEIEGGARMNDDQLTSAVMEIYNV